MAKNRRMTLASDMITTPTKIREIQIRAREALFPLSEGPVFFEDWDLRAIFESAFRHQVFVRNSMVTTTMVSTTDAMAAVCWPSSS
ncbi:MAG: hypothetical protein QF830_13750, partial [Rhodospirillales bacterium]|nr:hypothetical protein [Rhodospirillales bacterium]